MIASARSAAVLLLAVLAGGCGPHIDPPAVPTTVPPIAVPGGLSRPTVAADESWIEVDLAQQTVRLWRGDTMAGEFIAASGVATSTETTTRPGVYRVQQLIAGPIENVPGVWVEHIVIYDYFAGAGIHSLPMDAAGRVLDDRLGVAVSAGCVRVGDSAPVYDFARLGMTVWVH